ncbi:MAG: two-component sensor histidine kinase, partial [Polyangiaceae bacterium]|nr:two-component sensor histidine kinase [Polyangiaceae bacterium]
MLGQWAFALGLALLVTPNTWEGSARSAHPHVYAALFLGGAITLAPVSLGMLRPGTQTTRYVIAVSQMLWSALLIHLSGGRIETNFHIFGSLAFLAFYRDVRVIVLATLTVLADHYLRGLFLPQSVYAVAAPEWWRFLEHAGWVFFEASVLTVGCRKAIEESRILAGQQAELELVTESERAKSIALNSALGELRASQEALVRTEKLAAVGQLAASVGHELRNPLAAVRNSHAFLVKRLGPGPSADPRIAQFLDIIDREVRVCTRIIGDLLDFARERPPSRIPCPLRGLVDEATSVVPESSVRVVNDVSDELPIPTLDRDQFRQVLVNLIQNAVESVPEGRKGEVRVEAKETPDAGLHITI